MQKLDLHPAFEEAFKSGRKTQTRRVVDGDGLNIDGVMAIRDSGQRHAMLDRLIGMRAKYSIGEIVETPFGKARITCIRCERLQEISEEDCEEEGVYLRMDSNANAIGMGHPLCATYASGLPSQAFADMWGHLYPTGPKSWGENPPVFVYEFEQMAEDAVAIAKALIAALDAEGSGDE